MPTWTKVDGGLPATYDTIALEPDPWRPSARQYLLILNTVNGRRELYTRTVGNWSKLVDNLDLAAVWAAKWGQTVSSCFIYSIQADINVDGYISAMCGGYVGGTNHYADFLWSFDYGMTWQSSGVDHTNFDVGTNPGDYYHEVGDFAGGGYGGGQIIYLPLWGAGASARMARSVDKGVTFTTLDHNIIFWQNNGMGTDVYQNILYRWMFGGAEFDAASAIWRSIDSGVTWTQIFDGATYGALDAGSCTNAVHRYKVHPLLGNSGGAQIIRAITWDNRLAKTLNGGTSWTRNALPSGLTSECRLALSLVEDADAKLYGLNTHQANVNSNTHAVYVSEDEGVTWEGKAGTDRSPTTVSGIPYADGVIAILQVWDT